MSVDVRSLRSLLKLSMADFAVLIGVDTKTVRRWELGVSHPTGTALAVMRAFQEKLSSSDPRTADATRRLLLSAVPFGGLSFLIVQLLNNHTSRGLR